MATVTDIRRCGPAFRRRCIVIDGDTWREVPAALLALLAIKAGDEVDVAGLSARAESVEPGLARERALRLLTACERSREGLRRRLIEDGFSPSVAQQTVEDLVRVGLVDDERFAHALARTLANARGAGRSKIARELRDAGIEDSIAAAALEGALDVEQEESAAARLAAAAAAKPGATVDKVAARLMRRGYRAPIALAAARVAVEAAGASDDPDPSAQDPWDG